MGLSLSWMLLCFFFYACGCMEAEDGANGDRTQLSDSYNRVKDYRLPFITIPQVSKAPVIRDWQ
jgi:hypothetical protein